MPHINRSGELLGSERTHQRCEFVLVLEHGNELLDFEASRRVQNFNQLGEVVVLELDGVFLRIAK
jgi:hypothetical protein